MLRVVVVVVVVAAVFFLLLLKGSLLGFVGGRRICQNSFLGIFGYMFFMPAIWRRGF